MNVIIQLDVLKYLEELVEILYIKEYFGFLETSNKYVDELLDDIKINLPTKQHKPAPNYFNRYGKDMEYAVFRKNRHTSWYVFFRVYIKNKEEFYQVRYIANNHTIAQYL